VVVDYRKYRYMEMNLTQRKKALLEKIPDIQKTLDMVKFLKARRDGKVQESEELDGEEEIGLQKVTFELNDTLFAEAEIENSDVVYLWLGAKVMLSYTHDQAIALLTQKLAAANQSLVNGIEDLEYLTEQSWKLISRAASTGMSGDAGLLVQPSHRYFSHYHGVTSMTSKSSSNESCLTVEADRRLSQPLAALDLLHATVEGPFMGPI